MKLAELLARELKVWPEGETIVQDYYGDLGLYAIRSPKLVNGDENHAVWHVSGHIRNLEPLSAVATDHATAIVTRADWEAEVERLATGKPEWIRHRGGKCPVQAGVFVEVRPRGGSEYGSGHAEPSEWLSWDHNGLGTDIMAYRICEPEQQIDPVVVANVDAFNAQAELLYDPCAQGPLQWRDRIREIDAKEEERNEAHRMVIEALEEERAGLVQQLEDEGFQLIVL